MDAMQTTGIALMRLQVLRIAMPINMWTATPWEGEHKDTARLEALAAAASDCGYILGPRVQNVLYLLHVSFARWAVAPHSLAV